MTAQDLGWGPPGCTRQQLVRVVVPGMVDSLPYFPLQVRREVAPLFHELCLWLVAERKRRGLPPLTCSGGYNKRLIRGSSTAWSNHSWGLAGDFCVATNPMRSPLTTDMPPGTSAMAASLGMVWGGDYKRRPDPMHFEVVEGPDAVRRLVAGLRITTSTAPKPAPTAQPPSAPLEEDDDMLKLIRRDRGTGKPGHGATYLIGPGVWNYIESIEQRDTLVAKGVAKASVDVNDREYDLLREALLKTGADQ